VKGNDISYVYVQKTQRLSARYYWSILLDLIYGSKDLLRLLQALI